MTSGVIKPLVHRLQDAYSSYDGFVVLHGTDTMAYTASALSFMLEDLGKPVILTGSQVSHFVSPLHRCSSAIFSWSSTHVLFESLGTCTQCSLRPPGSNDIEATLKISLEMIECISHNFILDSDSQKHLNISR